MSKLVKVYTHFNNFTNNVTTSLAAHLVAFGLTYLLPRSEIIIRPEDYGMNYRDVEIEITDKNQHNYIFKKPKTLSAWLIDPKKNNPKFKDKTIDNAVVFFHGINANRADPPQVMEMAKEFVKQGIAVVMVDFRNHGKINGQKTSSRGRTTFGLVNEPKDVNTVINWVKQQGYTNLALYGISMGAAAILMALTQRSEVDPDALGVRVVAIDSCYSRTDEMVPDKLKTFARKVLKRIGADPDGMMPIDAIKILARRGINVLIIHNKNDTITPSKHSVKLAKAYRQAKNEQTGRFRGITRSRGIPLRLTDLKVQGDNQHAISLLDETVRQKVIKNFISALEKKPKKSFRSQVSGFVQNQRAKEQPEEPGDQPKSAVPERPRRWASFVQRALHRPPSISPTTKPPKESEYSRSV